MAAAALAARTRGARARAASLGRRASRRSSAIATACLMPSRPITRACWIGPTPVDPLRRTMVMASQEFERTPEESIDPLHEDADSPVPGLVHRYPDRVLFLTTGTCPVYCRYCTRSRIVGSHDGTYEFSTGQWERRHRLHRPNARDPRRAAVGRRPAGPVRRSSSSGCCRASGRFRTSSSFASARKFRSCCRSA